MKGFAIFYFPRGRIMLQAIFLLHILCCDMGQGLFEMRHDSLWVEAETFPAPGPVSVI